MWKICKIRVYKIVLCRDIWSVTNLTRVSCKCSCQINISNGFFFAYRDEVFCDIKLETDDHKVTIAHKVVLLSASPYFYAMFTNFSEKNHYLVVMREIDSTALQLLVNFIYSGHIVVTEENVQVIIIYKIGFYYNYTAKLFKLFIVYFSRICCQLQISCSYKK